MFPLVHEPPQCHSQYSVKQSDPGFVVVVVGLFRYGCFLSILGENNWPLAFNLYLLYPVVICQRTLLFLALLTVLTVSALEGV